MHGVRNGKYILLLIYLEVFPLLFSLFLMNLFTAVLGLPCRRWLVPVAVSGATAPAAVRGLPTAVVSLLLQSPGSRMGCSNCGPRAWVAAAHRLSCSAACWNLPGTRNQQTHVPPKAGGFLTGH